jgi:prolyl oligopeptidase
LIAKGTILRVARPTDNLPEIVEMYKSGLGFSVLAEFENHQGFDGVVLGNPDESYHIEFTHHQGTAVGKAPTDDNLLVFYIENREEWEKACAQAASSGFTHLPSYNPYWDVLGKTYQDIDGYRVVLQNSGWSV